MFSFKQWLAEVEVSPEKPKTATQKTVSKQISTAVADNPKSIETIRQGTSIDKNKIIGDLTANVVKTQQKNTPNIMGDKDAEIGDVIGNIDTQIKNVAQKAKMMKKK